MRDCGSEQPIYSETVGLYSAEVSHNDGVYSVFLLGDQVSRFLGESTSMEDCQDRIESVKELAKYFGTM